MKHTTSAWVAVTAAMPRSARGIDGFVHLAGAVARRSWLSNQQMATIKRPARHLGILTT